MAELPISRDHVGDVVPAVMSHHLKPSVPVTNPDSPRPTRCLGRVGSASQVVGTQLTCSVSRKSPPNGPGHGGQCLAWPVTVAPAPPFRGVG